MPLADRIYRHHEDIMQLAAAHGAKKVSLFGSVARGTDTESSDVDFLVEFEDGRSLFNVIRLKDDLETLLGRSVHIVTEKAVHPRIRDILVEESIRL